MYEEASTSFFTDTSRTVTESTVMSSTAVQSSLVAGKLYIVTYSRK